MIWLIGNKGMLGSDVETSLKEHNREYVASDLDVDITDYDCVEKYCSDKDIEWVINCSAYTNVDKAEDEEGKATLINGVGVKNIAKISKKKNAKLIHISTDYVFDGNKKDKPYTENDITNPIGAYGRSKLKGEQEIIKESDEYFIIRIAWLFGVHGKNFVYTMLRLFNEKDQVNIVSDQKGSPTYTKSVAEIILKIIQNNSNDYGIYHFTNKGLTTWYDFALNIYELGRKYGLINKETKILPITTEQYPTKAKRPQYSYLSKDKIEKTFNHDIIHWKTALEDFMKQVKEQ